MPETNALFLAANPKDTQQLALDQEIQLIKDQVDIADYGDMLTFTSALAVTPRDLQQWFNKHNPHIVHFSGHGTGKGIQLASADNQEVKLVTTLALKDLFTVFKNNIRLIFLNACYSQEQAEALREVVDCVIGMNDKVSDEAAAIFSSSFYSALAYGHSVQNAFAQARVALRVEGIPEEDVPQLLVKDGIDPDKLILVGPKANLTGKVAGPIEVFISYSPKDKQFLEKLVGQLANLQRQNVIQAWSDTNIVPGTEWQKEIRKHLESAQIILMLISADFMASDFPYSTEMRQVLQRHRAGKAIVLPILLRPTDYEGALFARLMPKDPTAISLSPDQDSALLNVVLSIRNAVNEWNSKH